ncbi:MAG: BREX-1 system adenine-specific DNA-methyltransferase PglX [Rhodoferax sp.]|nr:BREX-1 system adenine-specific DNA-methyltransferase PglX [Rhodoferax sp.]
MTLGEDVQSQVARGVAQWGSDPNSGQGSRGNQSGTTDLGSDPHWAGQTTTSLQATIATLIQTFEHAKTFGSLIQIPTSLKQQLPALVQMLPLIQQTGDLYSSAAADSLLPLVQQAQVMAMQFDVVVANPPYMGGKGMNPALKNFAKAIFPDSKSDLFAMFMERGFEWCKPSGFNSMVTMQSWMFLSSYEAMRVKLLKDRTIQTMAHLGARAFGEISGEVVQTTAFILQGQHFSGFKPVFIRLVEGQEDDKQTALRTRKHRFETTAQDEFRKITGSPVAYWVSEQLRATFSDGTILRATADVKQGLATGNNDRFMRFWAEVPLVRTGLNFDSREQARNSGKKWFPYSKGGEFRKWYGNREWLVNWANDGEEVRGFCDVAGNVLSRPRAGDYYFRESVTWTLISNTTTAFRFEPKGNVISHKGPGIFAESDQLLILLAFLNSRVSETLLKILAPSMSFEIGQVAQLPVLRIDGVNIEPVRIAREDWDSIEVSWDFQKLPWIVMSPIPLKMSDDWHKWLKICIDRIAYIKAIEEQNNRLFIAAYGLQSELSPEVPESQITLARADREKDCQRLISYAIGCMMGRYSLDEPGLIYAHAGNIGFDPSRYSKFPADADGIIPITDELWFEDDAAERVREFVRVVWGASPHPNPPPGGEGATAEASPAATVTTGGLEANMTWLAESLGTKASETPDETIRRYIADKFFKDHLQTYKKRPIYWLFSSGKHSAFQALVYLHRYHEGTLSRLRAEYVVPLTGKIQGRIEMLQKDAAAASSTAARNKLAKEVEKLKKKHVELLAYDEQLRHYADMRITLDLDDGVKVNYGKFGDLLDSVKIVTGGANDD